MWHICLDLVLYKFTVILKCKSQQCITFLAIFFLIPKDLTVPTENNLKYCWTLLTMLQPTMLQCYKEETTNVISYFVLWKVAFSVGKLANFYCNDCRTHLYGVVSIILITVPTTINVNGSYAYCWHWQVLWGIKLAISVCSRSFETIHRLRV